MPYRYTLLLPLAALLLASCDPTRPAVRTRPTATAAPAPVSLNRRLRRELDSIDREDQKYRLLLMDAMHGQAAPLDSLRRAAHLAEAEVGPYLSAQMIRIDSANIQRVVQLIRQYGYPGKTLVGEPTNEVALLVIQHSTRIPQLLPLIEQEAARGEIPYYLYARMLDRKLMQEGKAQLYGTQGRSFTVPNAQGQPETISFIWPIEDAAHVNARRKKAGFDSTVEANAERLRIPYRVVPLAEALRIERQAAAGRP
ncbi:DUF6624 domain-containing protein [Hymenobacter persicinus]|uniref:Lipoprotein n=1 Tax=Hymenobacter persicinus TaxID=2025506 RepID=A0A4Q5LE74_9BACT|nr:DUF6624 domain-containing protein [Hymenobacter persicinus]RYU80271.1 hypothetical protein EWM57_08790 [Hymenobacter persicinus]